ncbi:hypothetical protein [Streptomyces sp. NBC_00005]|uniref:hypothetical protein n=1 Tax=Streptomyces sp. NBC_00005 TaxID=2903609 RepID=UPI00324B10A4
MASPNKTVTRSTGPGPPSERGVSAVGAFVRDRAGAAVAVAAPSSRCPRARLTSVAQPLLAVVRGISRRL